MHITKPKTELGQYLRDGREKLRMSQAAAAELAGVTVQTISLWEVGVRSGRYVIPELHGLLKLAKGLRLSEKKVLTLHQSLTLLAVEAQAS